MRRENFRMIFNNRYGKLLGLVRLVFFSKMLRAIVKKISSTLFFDLAEASMMGTPSSFANFLAEAKSTCLLSLRSKEITDRT